MQILSHLFVPEAERAAVLLAELASHEPRLALRHRRRRGDVHGMGEVGVAVGRRFPVKLRNIRNERNSKIDIYEEYLRRTQKHLSLSFPFFADIDKELCLAGARPIPSPAARNRIGQRHQRRRRKRVGAAAAAQKAKNLGR